MRVYLNGTLPCFSYIALVACLGKVGHSAGAVLGAHVLNGKEFYYTLKPFGLFKPKNFSRHFG